MSLADRVMVLRDEVLDTVERGDGDPPGTDVFDAIVRALAAHGETAPGLDLTLHDAIARRLAWGDTEEVLLADADQVVHRLARAVERALRDPLEEMVVLEVAAEVTTAVARIVALAAVGRAQRDRAARSREELAQKRLREALAEQRATLIRFDRG
ncbi:MAG: hypothetical protein K8W52_05340 [Deltaproteobacteria bacterium]|nr:hypothetical protein [Deltaproteobacteria bacterium]